MRQTTHLVHLDLSPTLDAPRLARRAVVDALTARAWPADACDVAELLVSELVTNAVLHATKAVRIDLTVQTSRTRVTVFDHSPERPVLRHVGPTEIGGRGLLLVERFAADWGWEPRAGGKDVWFELPSPAS